MTDMYDRATETEELERMHAIKAHKARALANATTNRLYPTGQCLSPGCEAPFSGENAADRLFCEPACEREFSRMKR